MNKKVTIKEIARLADASVSTVSRVINNSGYVSDAKRRKIQSVIQNTGYHPSQIARTLSSNQTHTIAIMLPDITNPYFINLVEQISLISGESGYSVILVNTDTAGSMHQRNAVEVETEAFANILERQVDGLIIIGGEIDRAVISPRYIDALNSLNDQLPVVVISQNDEKCNCLFVQRHIDTGMRMIVQHLLALGYRRIGFLGGKAGIKIADQRVESFKKLMGLYASVSPKDIMLCDFYIQDGYNNIEKLLANTDLTAVIAINDQVALGAIRRLSEIGKHVPQDLAIASADMFADSEYSIPAITTVNQHDQSLGQIAVKQLLHLINNEPVEPLEAQLPELVMRESCGERLVYTTGEPHD